MWQSRNTIVLLYIWAKIGSTLLFDISNNFELWRLRNFHENDEIPISLKISSYYNELHLFITTNQTKTRTWRDDSTEECLSLRHRESRKKTKHKSPSARWGLRKIMFHGTDMDRLFRDGAVRERLRGILLSMMSLWTLKMVRSCLHYSSDFDQVYHWSLSSRKSQAKIWKRQVSLHFSKEKWRVLTRSVNQKYNQRPSLDIQCIENISIALSFLGKVTNSNLNINPKGNFHAFSKNLF